MKSVDTTSVIRRIGSFLSRQHKPVLADNGTGFSYLGKTELLDQNSHDTIASREVAEVVTPQSALLQSIDQDLSSAGLAIDRGSFLASAVTKDMFGLEVGPSFSPTFRRADGYNIETLDHASAEDLREKYKSHEVDIDRIEEVTYVSDGRPMHEIISRRSEYDFIFASHVIEHVTDPVGFMRSCEKLLKPSGKLILIVPDKRRCFDAFQALSTTGQLLKAFTDGATRHQPERFFDFFASIGDLSGATTWEQCSVGTMHLGGHLQMAKERFEAASAPDAPYEDIHGWYFTPSSFRLVVQDLNALGYVALREAAFHPTDRCEFYFTMALDGRGCDIARVDMLRAVMREQIEGGVQLLADTFA